MGVCDLSTTPWGGREVLGVVRQSVPYRQELVQHGLSYWNSASGRDTEISIWLLTPEKECLFIQQIFTEHLLCSRYSSRPYKYSGDLNNQNPFYSREGKDTVKNNHKIDQVKIKTLLWRIKMGKGLQLYLKWWSGKEPMKRCPVSKD